MFKSSLQELLNFNTWANRIILDQTAKMSDEQLDRSFPIGPGSLREAIRHLYSAERTWHERVGGPNHERLPTPSSLQSVPSIRDALEQVAGIRGDWLASMNPEALARTIKFRDRQGVAYVRRLNDILLHVCNHGLHHRAQAVNMIRRSGVTLPKPGPDYIFMKWYQPENTPTPLDVEFIQRYFAFSDAMQSALIDIASKLSDAQLDREFEMGMGTLRRTIVHIHNAEGWWHENWTVGPGTAFPASDGITELVDVAKRNRDITGKRNAMLKGMKDADLNRPVEVAPRPELRRTFSIGVSMLQLCCHGTHHRAQANNMLRHLEVEPLKLDYIRWCPED